MQKPAAEVTPIGVTSLLTDAEKSQLVRLESVVNRGLKTFIEVGNALLEIRDNRLYRAHSSSFDDYCRKRWGMSKTHANRIIQSAEVVSNLTPIGVIPISESQIRPLINVPPADQSAVWDLAVETAPEGKVTAKHVEEVVKELAPTSKPKPAKSKPQSKPPEPDPELTADHEALAAGIEDYYAEPLPFVRPDPPDIAAQRRAGLIGEDVEVQVFEAPDVDDQDEPPDTLAEQSEGEFLAACPARSKLNDPCLKVFDRDALLFRAVEENRKKFDRQIRPLINANKKRQPVGMYHYFLTTFLIRKHPKQWIACDFCKGTGQEVMIGQCHQCYGKGYTE